ncbi:MAG: SURF1 family protein [Gemmatimonadales bacterium]
MSRIRRTTLLITVLIVATIAVALGRWQLRRLHTRRASNAVLLAARARAPLQLPGGFAPGTMIDSGRRVAARGHFDTAGQIILRGRVQDDAPGVEIVTPFVIDSDVGVLWVLRGFVRSPDAVTPPDTVVAPVPGDVVVSGIAFATPVTGDSGRPLLYHGVTTWQRLDRAVALQRRPGALPVYLLLSGDANGPGRLATVPPLELSDGPHLSYAVQWFGIALAVLSFGVIMVWRDGRARPRRPGAP